MGDFNVVLFNALKKGEFIANTHPGFQDLPYEKLYETEWLNKSISVMKSYLRPLLKELNLLHQIFEIVSQEPEFSLVKIVLLNILAEHTKLHGRVETFKLCKYVDGVALSKETEKYTDPFF